MSETSSKFREGNGTLKKHGVIPESSDCSQTTCVEILALPSINCVTLERLLDFSVPWFPHL